MDDSLFETVSMFDLTIEAGSGPWLMLENGLLGWHCRELDSGASTDELGDGIKEGLEEHHKKWTRLRSHAVLYSPASSQPQWTTPKCDAFKKGRGAPAARAWRPLECALYL